jgi:ABC-type transport system involved in multi-copper enzyme maturation permease subunit
MSTTPFEPTDPSPAAAPDPTAPSALVASGATLARAVGFFGLFLAVLGVVVIVTTRAVGPRWVPESWGFLFGGVGLALMLYHAAVDGEQEVRRMYGGLALFLLVIATAVGVLPGPFDGGPKSAGHFLLPWGVFAGLLGLLFAIPFVRHETNDFYRGMALNALLGVGAVLTVGAVVAGLAKPDLLAGSAAAVALLGVGFLCAYLGQAETETGTGRTVAVALGVFGGLLVAYVLARTVFPTVLYDGPKDLRKANGVLEKWAVGARVLVILACLGYAAVGLRKGQSLLARVAFAGPGLIGAAVFVIASFSAPLKALPEPFLVPGGLILALLGFVLLAVSVGACSDHPFVVMVRRELATYFLSPIGYLVLAGMTLCQWLGYWQFWETLNGAGRQGQALPEPIVRFYLFDLIPILCVILPIPALTMRLLSEEKRSGSLEVLLTAPVNEWPVVLSKFLATWFFFMLCWVPAGLFLLAVRAEAGSAFDYRPLLSFYAALAACSAAFVASGLLFSALTSNQIVAAVLTFGLLLFLVVCYFVKSQMTGIGPTGQAFLARLSFIDLWRTSLQGQLPVRDVLVWASVAVFTLFLSVKVLETRKWS